MVDDEVLLVLLIARGPVRLHGLPPGVRLAKDADPECPNISGWTIGADNNLFDSRCFLLRYTIADCIATTPLISFPEVMQGQNVNTTRSISPPLKELV